MRTRLCRLSSFSKKSASLDDVLKARPVSGYFGPGTTGVMKLGCLERWPGISDAQILCNSAYGNKPPRRVGAPTLDAAAAALPGDCARYVAFLGKRPAYR